MSIKTYKITEIKGGKVPQGYNPPITSKLTDEVLKKIDDCIYGEVTLAVDINKEELFKALAYDRGQYNEGYRKGYLEGYKDGKADVAKDIAYVINDIRVVPEYKEEKEAEE